MTTEKQNHKPEEKPLSELDKKIDIIWNETMMIFSNEDYVLDNIEDLKGCISVFIGRAIKKEEERQKQAVKRLKEEKPEEKEKISRKLRNETHKNLYYNGYLLGFRSALNKVDKIFGEFK